MSIKNLLDQFLGASGAGLGHDAKFQSIKQGLSGIQERIPGGLVGGAAAGGILALLISNKSARKVAGTAAGYGGAALLGGLAYKAYDNWRQATPQAADAGATAGDKGLAADYQLLLVKAMIAAAWSDGHIDQVEQQRIFGAVEQMALSAEMKGLIFDLLQRPASVEELADPGLDLEQKSELYLASCLITDADNRDEQAHLDRLAVALQLPEALVAQLQNQARSVIDQAA